MKMIVAAMLVRFIISILGKDKKAGVKEKLRNSNAIHPAEFRMR